MYAFNQPVHSKPEVLIESGDNVRRKLLNVYRKHYEPLGRTLVVGLDLSNPEAADAVDKLTAKGYHIVYNLQPWDYPQEDYKYII